MTTTTPHHNSQHLNERQTPGFYGSSNYLTQATSNQCI